MLFHHGKNFWDLQDAVHEWNLQVFRIRIPIYSSEKISFLKNLCQQQK
jgi:hypothetical protein